jgi:hypothetical protein
MILRRAASFALTTAMLALATVGIAPSATAQTVGFNLPVNVRIAGPSPTGITGYEVTTTCRLLQAGVASNENTVKFGASGGSFSQAFNLTPTSQCSVKLVATGTGAAIGVAVISIGTVARATGVLGATQTLDSANNVTPVAAATTIDIVITFPSLIVKKAVFGTELIANADYTMAVACAYGDGVLAGSTTFKLRAGGSKTVTVADIPGLVAGATCYVAETDIGGAAVATFASTNSNGTTTAGINFSSELSAFNPFTAAGICPQKSATGACESGYTYASAGTQANGQTVTVTNRFVGDLLVSKVVVGDPKSNIGIYELQVACSNASNVGPNESFLLKDRQTKVFTGIVSGTTCTVSETRSDGAVATLADNSGESATDGKVVIRGSVGTCNDPRIASFPDCRANVIVTNSYASATPAAVPSPTAAPATTAAAVTTSAPVAAAPVEEPAVLADSEETVG